MLKFPRIAVGGFQHETNTFALQTAPFSEFVKADAWPGLTQGDALFTVMSGLNIPLAGFIQAAQQKGYALHPMLWCAAEPSSFVTTDAFERIARLLCDALQSAEHLDGVYLDLHGAMVVENYADGEGELLRRVRSVVGADMPIIVSLDLHANVTEAMLEQATAITIFRTYPHLDMATTGARALQLMTAALDGKKIVGGMRKIPFLFPLSSQCTDLEPCRTIYQYISAVGADKPGFLNAEFATGFPPADIYECGAAVLAYATSKAEMQQILDDCFACVLDAEPRFNNVLLSPDEATLAAMQNQTPKPVVLADAQDNPGAGGASDTTGLLEALVNNQARGAVIAIIHDPTIASLAHQLGVGATFTAELGGKSKTSGVQPYKSQYRVESLGDGNFTCSGEMYKGSQTQLGPMALLSVLDENSEVRVIVGSERFQCLDLAIFRHLGVEPTEQRILGVKSTVHFRADFDPIAAETLVVVAHRAASLPTCSITLQKPTPGHSTRTDGATTRARFRQITMHGNAGVAKSTNFKPSFVRALLGIILTISLLNISNASELILLQANQLSDGHSAIDLTLSDKDIEVQHFVLADPNRIVVDLFGVQNKTKQTRVKLSQSAVESVVLLESQDKLRLILNLAKPAIFNVAKRATGLRLIVDTGAHLRSHSNQLLQRVLGASKGTASSASITDVDFRRTPTGNGKIIVSLSSANVVVDFNEERGELIADFKRSSVSAVMEKRLDVMDFATPVSTIDLFQNGQDVRMVVTPTGEYRTTITQINREFVIEVSAISARELAAVKQQQVGYSGEKISLNFQKIPVRAALQIIADFTKLNIITSDSVDGNLSLRLNEVPWGQVLDLILQTKNLGMRQQGNVIRIAPIDELAEQELALFESQKKVTELEPLVTELIRVNYAKAEDIALLLKSTKTVTTFENQQTEFRSGGSDSNLFDPLTGTFQQVAEPTTITHNNVVKVDNSLISERGSVSVDDRTNTILIQDTAAKIKQVSKLVAKLDVRVRQVQIETRIVEATDDFSRSLGARIGFTRVTEKARSGVSDDNRLGTVLGDSVFGGGSIEANDAFRTRSEVLYPDSLSVNLGADSLGTETASRYAFQIAKVGAGYLHLLDLELSALQAEGKGKVIANPKITTTEKREASIEQGQERVFGISGGKTVTKKAVLGLTVTPQVTPNEEIILDVTITHDTFSGDTTLNTKRVTTQTLLKNGETIVIGGIYQQSQGEYIAKTPLLGDIPILGNLFKKKTKRNNRTELLIFLTPRLIKPEF